MSAENGHDQALSKARFSQKSRTAGAPDWLTEMIGAAAVYDSVRPTCATACHSINFLPIPRQSLYDADHATWLTRFQTGRMGVLEPLHRDPKTIHFLMSTSYWEIPTIEHCQLAQTLSDMTLTFALLARAWVIWIPPVA